MTYIVKVTYKNKDGQAPDPREISCPTKEDRDRQYALYAKNPAVDKVVVRNADEEEI